MVVERIGRNGGWWLIASVSQVGAFVSGQSDDF